jgi:hypothetical protein
MADNLDMLRTATNEADALAMSLAARCDDRDGFLAVATALIRAGSLILQATGSREIAAAILYQHADDMAAPQDKAGGVA